MTDQRRPDPSYRNLAQQPNPRPITLTTPTRQMIQLDHLTRRVRTSEEEDGRVGQSGHGEISHTDIGVRARTSEGTSHGVRARG